MFAFVLDGAEHAVGAVELEFESSFVAVEVVAGLEGGDLVGIGEVVGVGVVDLGIYDGGFGGDDAPVAPEGVGDHFDEVFLQGGMGAEFHFDGVEKVLVVFGGFLAVLGIDDDIIGCDSEFEGVF